MSERKAPGKSENEPPFEFYCSNGKMLQLKSGESAKMVGKRVNPELYFGPGSKGDEFVRFGVLELDGSGSGGEMKSKLLWDAAEQWQTTQGTRNGPIEPDPDTESEPEPDAPKEKEPVLCEEQQRVLDTILEGRNVFYTGSAGCGKSTVLRTFVPKLKKLGKTVHIVCPTNLAALNVNGVTYWHYAGWRPDDLRKPLPQLVAKSHGPRAWKRLLKTDVLVIDEISMVENLALERLNEAMKSVRKDWNRPFGGVQVVVTGDFCQLAPVKPFEYCIECGWELEADDDFKPVEYKCENEECSKDVYYNRDKWAFSSVAWKECNFEYINLTKVHRQTDRKFLTILNRIRRDGRINPNHGKVLLNNMSKMTEGAIQLHSTKEEVRKVNEDRIEALPSPAVKFMCLDDFKYKPHHRISNPELEDYSERSKDYEGCSKGKEDGTLKALQRHRYDKMVTLKQDMRVVLQHNLDPDYGLVNGAQGTVIDFEEFSPENLPCKTRNGGNNSSGAPQLGGAHPKYAQAQIKLFAENNGNPDWPVVQFDNGQLATIFPDCAINEFGDGEPFSLLSRTQIPLMAGYAVTIHKAQGMTLEKVEVNLARAFDSAQLYVALSRATCLEGLKVTALPIRILDGTDPQVKKFSETYLQPEPAT